MLLEVFDGHLGANTLQKTKTLFAAERLARLGFLLFYVYSGQLWPLDRWMDLRNDDYCNLLWMFPCANPEYGRMLFSGSAATESNSK